jgi:hypothetical protein
MCLHHHTNGHPIADDFTSRVGILRGAAPRTWACSDTWRDCMHRSRRVSSVELAAGNFHSVAELAEFCREALAVVALQLNHAILHGAARPAEALERLRDAVDQSSVVWQPRHDGHGFASASLAVTREAHDAIAWQAGPRASAGVRRLGGTAALSFRSATTATGAYSADSSAINDLPIPRPAHVTIALHPAWRPPSGCAPRSQCSTDLAVGSAISRTKRTLKAT